MQLPPPTLEGLSPLDQSPGSVASTASPLQAPIALPRRRQLSASVLPYHTFRRATATPAEGGGAIVDPLVGIPATRSSGSRTQPARRGDEAPHWQSVQRPRLLQQQHAEALRLSASHRDVERQSCEVLAALATDFRQKLAKDQRLARAASRPQLPPPVLSAVPPKLQQARCDMAEEWQQLHNEALKTKQRCLEAQALERAQAAHRQARDENRRAADAHWQALMDAKLASQRSEAEAEVATLRAQEHRSLQGLLGEADQRLQAATRDGFEEAARWQARVEAQEEAARLEEQKLRCRLELQAARGMQQLREREATTRRKVEAELENEQRRWLEDMKQRWRRNVLDSLQEVRLQESQSMELEKQVEEACQAERQRLQQRLAACGREAFAAEEALAEERVEQAEALIMERSAELEDRAQRKLEEICESLAKDVERQRAEELLERRSERAALDRLEMQYDEEASSKEADEVAKIRAAMEERFAAAVAQRQASLAMRVSEVELRQRERHDRILAHELLSVQQEMGVRTSEYEQALQAIESSHADAHQSAMALASHREKLQRDYSSHLEELLAMAGQLENEKRLLQQKAAVERLRARPAGLAPQQPRGWVAAEPAAADSDSGSEPTAPSMSSFHLPVSSASPAKLAGSGHGDSGELMTSHSMRGHQLLTNSSVASPQHWTAAPAVSSVMDASSPTAASSYPAEQTAAIASAILHFSPSSVIDLEIAQTQTAAAELPLAGVELNHQASSVDGLGALAALCHGRDDEISAQVSSGSSAWPCPALTEAPDAASPSLDACVQAEGGVWLYEFAPISDTGSTQSFQEKLQLQPSPAGRLEALIQETGAAPPCGTGCGMTAEAKQPTPSDSVCMRTTGTPNAADGPQTPPRASAVASKGSAVPRVYEKALLAVEKHGWHQVHAPDAAEWTALHWAASEGRSDVCVRLIKAKADPQQPDHMGCAALDYALEAGHMVTWRILAGAISESPVKTSSVASASPRGALHSPLLRPSPSPGSQRPAFTWNAC
eukprot:TRINITY_DN65457_c0_g1_i1.p1 TRINITY_DN65457_c0_g1~~TRINITY_DN65457_c0_g1_i1.p1  ORF type:complete len:1013 (-),score=276.43 TRINITY_DN65457_c0_g1_i1:43-3081(-)